MKISDLFFGSHLDDTGLLKDVQTAGDKAGSELGSRIGKGVGLALKGGLGIIAGGAAIAVRGLQELDTITAKFQADTGATAEEAKRAGQAINEMAGRNLQPLSEVADALTVVHTDLGLTGAEAEKATEQFLKYATATGQNAAGAVKAFDDVLDAWGLTAKDAQGIMDKLIVSHQKYGGSIEANQRALAQFAPQLTALNATIDDGIGLLNLFAASGLDAEAATKALNTAVTKLKPGQNLNDLIAEITKIEDPTKRAQKAIEIFGSKGGVALANALRPGIGGLKAFEVGATEAAGATQKASDAIEGTFGNRVKLAIKAVGAEIIGLGQDFGPVLSGLAGLASLAGSLGLDRALAGGWRKIAGSGVVRAAAAEAGVAIGAVYGAAAGATEHVVELVKDAWKELAGSAAVKLLATKAGAIVGAVYGGAAKFAEAIAEGVSDAFVRLPFAPKVRAAVLAAAVELGTLQGTAMGSAIAAAFAAAPLVIPLLLVPTLTKLPSLLPEGDQKKMADAFWGSLNDPDALSKAARAAAANPAAAAGVTSAGTNLGEKAGDAMVAAFRKSSPALASSAKTVTEKAGDAMVAAWRQSLRGLPPGVADALQTIEKLFESPEALAVLKASARRSALLVMGQWAQGFRDSRDAVDQAWQDMLDGLKHPVTVTAETVKLLGELVSKKLQQGIHSGDPAVKDQAEYTKQLIIDRLNELKPRAGTLSKEAMANVRKAMHSADPDIAAAATAIYNAAIHGNKGKGPSTLPAAGTKAGSGLTSNMRHQLEDGVGPVGLAATNLATTVAKNIVGTITNWPRGKNNDRGRAAGGPVSPGQVYTVGEYHPETFVPSVPGYILPFDLRALFGQLSWAGAGGGDTYNIAVKLEGKASADNPIEVARQLSRFAQNGAFTTPKRK